MMKCVLAALSALSLAACSTMKPGVEIRRVEVPVPMPCIPRDQIPDEPQRVGDALTGNAAADLQIVSASALQLREWGQKMRGALLACAE